MAVPILVSRPLASASKSRDRGFRIVDGKIKEYWRHDDEPGLLMQVGLIPMSTSSQAIQSTMPGAIQYDIVSQEYKKRPPSLESVSSFKNISSGLGPKLIPVCWYAYF
jgi:hypothetical protein